MIKKCYYILSSGELKRDLNTLVLIKPYEKFVIPVETVDSLKVFSEIKLNKRVLEFLSKKKIPVHFFNYFQKYIGTFYPLNYMNSGYVLLKQVEYYLNSETRLFIAKSIVESSVRNMLYILRSYKSHGKELSNYIELLEKVKNMIYTTETIPQLLSVEGNSRAKYYSAFNKILNNQDFYFERRTKRPPKDFINSLLSLGNSMLYSTVLNEIYRSKLDPRIGYLHETNERAFTLNLDIAEIFKPIIVDKVIFKLINKKMIKSSDFSIENNFIRLKESKLKKFILMFEKRLDTTIKLAKSKNTKVSFRQLIRRECYKLINFFVEDKLYKPFVLTR